MQWMHRCAHTCIHVCSMCHICHSMVCCFYILIYGRACTYVHMCIYTHTYLEFMNMFHIVLYAYRLIGNIKWKWSHSRIFLYGHTCLCTHTALGLLMQMEVLRPWHLSSWNWISVTHIFPYKLQLPKESCLVQLERYMTEDWYIRCDVCTHTYVFT
jgi:hypothetical protein